MDGQQLTRQQDVRNKERTSDVTVLDIGLEDDKMS